MKNFILKLVPISLFIVYNNVHSQNIFALNLKTIDGKIFKLNETKKNNAVAYIFLSPENSTCQKYTSILNEQQKLYSQKKIKYIVIICGKQYTIQEINHFKKLFNIQLDILIDEKYELKKILGATVTPESFLVTSLGKTIYSGKIDDLNLSSNKENSKEQYLKDAINLYLMAKPIKIKRTTPIGSFIE